MMHRGVSRHSSSSRSSSAGKIFFPLAVATLFVVFSTAASRQLPVGIVIDPAYSAGNATPSQILVTGATWVRFEYKTYHNPHADDEVNEPPLPDYATVVSGFNAAGIATLVVLDTFLLKGMPGNNNLTQWDEYIDAFVQRVSSVATMFRSMHGAFEIWSEEDSDSVFSLVPAAAYARMLRRCYEAIKAVNATMPVIMGGLNRGDTSYLQSVISANNGTLYADVVALHPYAERPTQNWPSPTWGNGVISQFVSNFTNAVPHLRVLISEVGTDDLSVQGQFPSRMFESLATMSSVVGCFWFCWSDGMVYPFGLVDDYGKPKAAYYSFRNYTHAA